MMREEFDSFFEGYAKNVDNANQQNFWKLSDALILEIIKRNIPDMGEGSLILDAGGGTARWAILLSKIYRSRFTSGRRECPPFEGGDESPPRNSRAAALRGMRVAASAPGGALFV